MTKPVTAWPKGASLALIVLGILVLAFTRGSAEVLAYMPAVAWRSGTGMVTWNEMAA